MGRGSSRFVDGHRTHRWGLARSTFVLLAMWALGLSVLGGVFVLEQRLEARSQAQVLTAQLRKEVSDLTPVAFRSNEGLTQEQVRIRLLAAEGRIRLDTAQLSRLADDPNEGELIMSPAREMFRVLDRVNDLASSGKDAQAGALIIDAAARPAGAEYKLARVFTRLSVSYDQEAASARAWMEGGAFFAVIAVLLAFSLAFQRATALARQKHHEALTDPLTGLANRRKLFADVEELLARERQPGETLALGMFDLNGFKLYNDTFGHPAGDALLSRLGQKLTAAIGDNATAYRMGGDEFCVIAAGAHAEAVLAKAQSALGEENDDFTVTCSIGSVLIEPDQTTLEQAFGLADQRLYDDKRASKTRGSGEAHNVLMRVLAENSSSLATHLSNVGQFAVAVAQKLGLPEDEVALTRLTAELHDIGKTAVPNAILDKPGPLNDGEWDFIRRHTIIGERILAAAPTLTRIAPLVRATHERVDGAGYPDGLRADEIPLSSRIVAVVDAYDAMTSKRAYSVPLTPEQAIGEIRRCAGSQFDPAVAEAFIAVCQEKAAHAAANQPSAAPAGLAA